jgi:hypothetical protein
MPRNLGLSSSKASKHGSRPDISLCAKQVRIPKDLATQPLYRIDDTGTLVLFELPGKV